MTFETDAEYVEKHPNPPYVIILNIPERLVGANNIANFMHDFCESVCGIFGGRWSVRIPILPGRGHNYCIYFTKEMNYEYALKQVKKVLHESQIDYISVYGENRSKPTLYKSRTTKTKKRKSTRKPNRR